MLLAVFLVACAKPSINPVSSEKVMLDVECGWEQPPSLPDNPDDTLIITDSIDDYSEQYIFTGLRTPELVEGPIFFDGTAIELSRYEVSHSHTWVRAFVSRAEDYKYIASSLNELEFSDIPSERTCEDYRIIIDIYEQEYDEVNEKDKFYVCADGIVLILAYVEDGFAIYYESLTPIDYYHISALHFKYSQRIRNITWEFSSQTIPKYYRLCISSSSLHRDFTLEESEEILTFLLNVKDVRQIEMVTKINHKQPSPLESYVKITEYTLYTLNPLEIKEQTIYLTPEGKLIYHLGTTFGERYYSGHWESFKCNRMFISIEDFDYDTFLEFLNE